MSLLLLFILIALASSLLYLRLRRVAITLYAIALLGILSVASGLVPRWLLTSLQAPYAKLPVIQWGHRNVIILLGGGVTKVPGVQALEMSFFAQSRVLQAAMRYRQCKASRGVCRILISGGDPEKKGESEAAVYRRALQQLGIADTDLLLERRSANTWQNAQFSARLLQKEAADRLVLVTSGYHLQRSMLYFAHFGYSPVPVRADYIAVGKAFRVAQRFFFTDVVLNEYLGIARYYVYNLLGWNAPGTRQASGR